MHFPDHPTGPLPVAEGGGAAAAGGGGGVGVIPRSADVATADLLKALLAADPARRPRASDALQVGLEGGGEALRCVGVVQLLLWWWW